MWPHYREPWPCFNEARSPHSPEALPKLLASSRAGGAPRAGSDLDVAAWWEADPPAAWDIDLPHGVDLLILNGAPLELAGRVALQGEPLFDDDPPARVQWQAQTRIVYLDEEDRQRGLDRLFFGARARGG